MLYVKLADTVFAIKLRFRVNRKRFTEWKTCRNPNAIPIRLTDEELAAEADGAKKPIPYHEFLGLQRKISHLLLEKDTVLMHASVIDVDGKGYAFTAPSGTGKTTQTQLWIKKFGTRAQVVNGDKPFVRFADGQIYAYGTPWRGKEGLGGNLKTPLKAICFLEQAETNEIRKMESKEVLPRLMKQLLIPMETGKREHFLDLTEQMLKQIDWYLMRCNLDEKTAEMAYREMSKNHAED